MDWRLPVLVLAGMVAQSQGNLTFLKSTNLEYSGSTYYTFKNLSLYECHKWCQDERECVAAVFSYVLAGVQDTTCLLQNDTDARKPTALPQTRVNTYFFNKVNLRTENLCGRLWTFERFPNKLIRGLDNAILYTASRESCLAACLTETRFVCRSAEFNYVTLECHLSDADRRRPSARLLDSQGVDYFENSCLQADQVCASPARQYHPGLPTSTPVQPFLRRFVGSHYYPDKQILVSSRLECQRQCSLENTFVCRSLLFNAETRLCNLYHLDSAIFAIPEPPPSYTAQASPMEGGVYLETACGTETLSGGNRTSALEVQESRNPLPEAVSAPTTTAPVKQGDPTCDVFGVCYDVSIQCTESKIAVHVKTNKPFRGRIYALGRSETCNAHVHNSQKFQLDLSLTGQECNTQSMGGVYTNTVVLQHHNVVLTKADKVYNVRCTYETSSRNVTFGMMPVRLTFRDPETVQVTAAPEAPLPRLLIMGLDGREATTVQIGDRLTFHIEIPENTPYGIFARSCVAMAKDARSTFEVIDERGCPVDSAIFPKFQQIGANSLESTYEAFRFTESYGVIFQCNVKYCIGTCEPVNCDGEEESWGRRRRRRTVSDDEMTLSKEILVLDFGDEGNLTFLKSTNLEYSGSTYYTFKNLSLYECHKWCQDERECVAAVFSYVLAGVQDTTCLLQNDTDARKPTALPQTRVNTYFFNKVNLRTDNAILYTASRESCLAACLTETRFVCRSAEFNYVTLECHLSDADRRRPSARLLDSQGVDYFENSCLQADQVCASPARQYHPGLPTSTPVQPFLRRFVGSHYYPDKQILVSSRLECQRQCSLENTFVCRSLLFNAETRLCNLYHLDSAIFAIPEPPPSYTAQASPMEGGVYLETACGTETLSGGNRTSALEVQESRNPLPEAVSAPTTTAPVKQGDPTCDVFGVCYDVSIQCTESKIAVHVKTNKPFRGRIYALGRSETCNAHVHNSQKFQLDLSLTGQECNTQSMGGVYTNTVVLQHHNVVLTKADKVYNVRCTYETSSRNVTFGMMPVRLTFRDPETVQVTAAPEAPLPRLLIMGLDGREATTVQIGDRLTFHIEIPENTPYGIFARSCVAMAKDARSTFEVIDERGCPVDSAIFPKFQQIGANSLESTYEAFRFTESYGVIFQCNVKYCIGTCEPVNCDGEEESWGRRRRRRTVSDDEMTLSKEILVLDFGDEGPADSMRERSQTNNATHPISKRSLNEHTDLITDLNTTSFRPTVLGKETAWVVEFYQSWCGFCQRFAPIYKEFAKDVFGGS
ncbi:hypothetical protein LAZ67_17002369 [Cordylochernes scorpioides]|uniref:Uncharacterized protein n=1 Tax=Cordylochernes scorpioides TaxID=51811 RepID=A0ABY6LDX5_9ARAC|nr:hypothetical protein LAZ67_17002369 [Cordylochernes scorpioides]